MNRSYKNFASGFTLMEALVALALFATIASIAITALLSLSSANSKSQATREIVNNIAFVFEDLTSEARWGSFFTCDIVTYTNPLPCPAGSTKLAFSSVRDFPHDLPGDQGALGNPVISYYLENGVIWKRYGDTAQPQPLSSPTLAIEDLKFYVYGNTADDNEKARVLAVVKARIGQGTKYESSMTLQTTVTQRVQD